MKILSILYSLLTLPIFGLIEFILLPLGKFSIIVLKLVVDFLEEVNFKLVKLNIRLAQKSGRTKCKHYATTFLAPGYPDYQERCQLNTYQCLDCEEIIQKYDEIYGELK